MNNMKDNPSNEQAKTNQQENKPVLEAGEKVFSLVLLIVGLVALGLSLELWSRMSEPKIASAAALPLFVSILWVLMALLTVLENIKLKTPLSEIKNLGEKAWKGLQYAFPMDVLVMLVAIVAYCVALVLGINFYISTGLFLYATMCYLLRKDFLKNILWTALVMAFIVVVFRMLFGVVFPS